MKEIVLPKGNITKLAKAIGVNRHTVSSALHFHSNTDKSNQIRTEAIAKWGGILIQKVELKF